jgi:hypothetical protein
MPAALLLFLFSCYWALLAAALALGVHEPEYRSSAAQ